MPRKFVAGLVIGSLCTVATIYHFKPTKGTVNQDLLTDTQHYVHPNIRIAPDARWVSVEDIEQSLKNTPPMNVGFDIDDTVLFPNTSFHVSYEKFCKHDTSEMKKECTKNPHFWDDINTSGNLSPPKNIGKDLIEMHKRRGDKIFFITAREKSKFKPETMSNTLRKTFDIENMHEVIYLGMSSINTQKPGKTNSIVKHNIKIFYGDSDADIAAAIAAGVRGIRVIRAPNSQDNFTMPVNGRYGEEVIIGSDM